MMIMAVANDRDLKVSEETIHKCISMGIGCCYFAYFRQKLKAIPLHKTGFYVYILVHIALFGLGFVSVYKSPVQKSYIHMTERNVQQSR